MPFFAKAAAAPLNPDRLALRHQCVSAALAETSGRKDRFLLSLERDLWGSLRASQTNLTIWGIHQIVGQGAHKLHRADGSINALPSLNDVGPLGYLSIRQPLPLHAAYHAVLRHLLGAEHVEPRMLRVMDRLAYWSCAAACELGALVGVALRYSVAALYVVGRVPYALYRATVTRNQIPRLLAVDPNPAVLCFELKQALLSQQLRAPTPTDLAQFEVPLGFARAMQQGLVVIDSISDEATTEPQVALSPKLPPATQPLARATEAYQQPIAHQLIVLGRLPSNFDQAPLGLKKHMTEVIRTDDAHRHVVEACKHNTLWARAVMMLATQDSLRTLADVFAKASDIRAGERRMAFVVPNATREIRILPSTQGPMELEFRLTWEHGHRMQQRFSAGTFDTVHASATLTARVRVPEPDSQAGPLKFTVENVELELRRMDEKGEAYFSDNVFVG